MANKNNGQNGYIFLSACCRRRVTAGSNYDLCPPNLQSAIPTKKKNKKSIRPNAKQQQQQSKTKQNKTQKDYHHPSGTDTLPLYPNPQGPGRNWP